MLSLLLSLFAKFRVGLAELAGVGLLAAAGFSWQRAAGLAVLGAAVLLKSLDWEMKGRAQPPRELRP